VLCLTRVVQSQVVRTLRDVISSAKCVVSANCFIVCVLGYRCTCCSCCICFVFAVVVNRICFVFIVVGCPLLLCFVYCVLIECVVTSCNVCYLSVMSLLYYCHRAKTQLQLNK
jgi:hypothetical protein